MAAHALFHPAPRCVEIGELPATCPGAGEVFVPSWFSDISGGTERTVYRGELPGDLALADTIGALSGCFRYPSAYKYGAAAGGGRRAAAGASADRAHHAHVSFPACRGRIQRP